MWGHGESAALLSSQELDQRLERWANWARSPSMGSPGSVVGYLKERLDIAHANRIQTVVLATDTALVTHPDLGERRSSATPLKRG